jgi:hypothetical protein
MFQNFTVKSSVSIIILNWNGWRHTRKCLESLSRGGFPESDIIIVDNASIDDSRSNLKKSFKSVHLIENKVNEGFTGGNNAGIRYALAHGYEYILLLNNDTTVSPGFWHVLVEEMRKSDNLAAIQPFIYCMEPENQVWNAGGNYHRWLGYSQTNLQAIDKYPYPTEWITGCAIMVRAAILEEVGLLDNSYFAYFEDVDWSLRMSRQGYALKVHPQAVIYHEAGAASKSERKGPEGILDPKVHFLNVRNQIFQLRKYCRNPKYWLAWPFHFTKFGLFILYFLVKGRRRKRKAVISGIWEGLRTPLKVYK